MATAVAQALASLPEKLPHPLKSRNFALWWTGATLSLLGDQFYIVALPWLVLQMTGSALTMGMVSMCAGVPRAVLMLMGGAVADRMSPRKLMMITATAAKSKFVHPEYLYRLDWCLAECTHHAQ